MNNDTSLPSETPGSGEAAPEDQAQRNQRMAIIEAFSLIIKEKRKDAIDARKSSGIEEVWQEDQDHYDGEDDATGKTGQILKGRTTSDGLTTKAKDTTTRSTVFLKITRPYVDAAAARVSDMLLPTDDRNFALRAGKIAELTKFLTDTTPAGPDGKPLPPAPDAAMVPNQPPPNAGSGGAGAVPPQAQKPGIMASIKGMFSPGQGVPPAVPPTQQPTVGSMAKATIEKAKASAERAQDVIDDWLTECHYHAEVRKIIEGAAKVGTGILKGPTPALKRMRAASLVENKWTAEMKDKLAPTSKAVSHWNFYPDGACGDDIQRGSYVFECDDITARGLLDLKAEKRSDGSPTYLADAINQCIEEGPTSPIDGTRKNKVGEKTAEKDLFQIWYFHGQVSKQEMEAAGCKCGDKETYPAMVTMVNDRVIKVTLSPLDSGEFPYDVMVWQARTDHWAGVGVSRQMRECQKGANAAVRNLMDNAGLSAGPQIVIDRNKIVPANGRYELTPRKVWYTKDESEVVGDVKDAFHIFSIETRQAELMNILQFWLKEAEDVTGLPMLLQGQQGSAPDTVGGMQIINNNGSTVLRRIARTFDDRVTEPHIGRYYEYLLLWGPDDAKGDFQVDARGSSALVERDLQQQSLPQLLGLSVNPAYGLDPELLMQEILKSMRLDTKGLLLSDEKKAEMASRPPPKDPRIEAAEIMAKSKGDALVAGAQTAKMKLDHDAKQAAEDRQLEEVLAGVDARLKQDGLALDEREMLGNMKVRLADTAIRLQAQRDMQRERNAQESLTPAAEPAGRAPNGQAFVA